MLLKTNSSKLKAQSGFTLIEILVVIAIIGILASIVLVNVGSFRGKGRDTRRIGDLRSTQNILELYYAKYNVYPPSSTWAVLTTTLTDPANGLGILKVPKDPADPAQTYWYGVSTGAAGEPTAGQSYVLGAKLEQENTIFQAGETGTVYGVTCGKPVYCTKF